MTTKEIEKLSGIDRANIRFYERERLITPKRMDNGYRDYTEVDLEGGELPYVFKPWPRFLARVLDLSIYNLIWLSFLIFVFNVNLLNRSNIGNLFDAFVSLAIMLVLEPLFLHLFGTTPGKAIFGLKIKSYKGRRLLYSEGLHRTWGVLSRGMGYNIPIYNLFRLWKSYKLSRENEIQIWDDSISYTKEDNKAYRGVLFAGTYIVIIIISLTVMSMQQIPPNRGDLTLEKFVENYNYYADFYGIDFGGKYLDERGKWDEKEFDGTVYIEVTYSQMPNYNYIIEDGYVTGVSFKVELDNYENWIGSYDNQMILSSLSFAGAQKEMGLLSKIPMRITNEIKNNTFEDFNFIQAGIEFACSIKHSGYLETETEVLMPDGSGAKNYFRLDFSAKKLK